MFKKFLAAVLVFAIAVGLTLVVLSQSGTGTEIKYQLASAHSWINGHFAVPIHFIDPPKNCVGFDIEISVSSKTNSPTVGSWSVHVQDGADQWKKVGMIAVRNNKGSTQIVLNSPITLKSVAVIKPNKSVGSEYECEYDISNPVFSTSQGDLGATVESALNDVTEWGEEAISDIEHWGEGVLADLRAWDGVRRFENWWNQLDENHKPIIIVVVLLVAYEILSKIWEGKKLDADTASTVATTHNALLEKGVSAGVGAFVKGIVSSAAFATLMSTVVGSISSVFTAVQVWYTDLDDTMKVVVIVLLVLVIKKVVDSVILKFARASVAAAAEKQQ